MSLITMKELLQHAQDNRYAVGYFESWNLESLQSVVLAAENMRSPVIVGFGGFFVGNRERKYKEAIEVYASMADTLARKASVPVATLLNEADDLSLIYRGIKAGFGSVMYQDEKASNEQNIKVNQKLVPVAHACGVSVEAEIDVLPTANITTGEQTQGRKTNPEEAVDFVKRTQVDALAVAVGNVHLLENEKAALDLDLISELRKCVPVPLVIHGGTGADPDSIRAAVELGVVKINVGTVLKRAYLNAVEDYYRIHETRNIDPHDIIGKGGPKDMLMMARDAMIESTMDFMRIFGSENKAQLI